MRGQWFLKREGALGGGLFVNCQEENPAVRVW